MIQRIGSGWRWVVLCCVVLGWAGLGWVELLRTLTCYSPEIRPDRLAEEEDILGCSFALGDVEKGPQLLGAT